MTTEQMSKWRVKGGGYMVPPRMLGLRQHQQQRQKAPWLARANWTTTTATAANDDKRRKDGYRGDGSKQGQAMTRTLPRSHHGPLVYERSTKLAKGSRDEQALMHELRSQLGVQKMNIDRSLSLPPQQADLLLKLQPRQCSQNKALFVPPHLLSNAAPDDHRLPPPPLKLHKNCAKHSPTDRPESRPHPSLSTVTAISPPSNDKGSARPDVCGQLEEWFLSKFLPTDKRTAFDGFCSEFDVLQKQTAGTWTSDGSRGPPLLRSTRTAVIRKPHNVFAVNAHTVEGLHGRKYIACEGPNHLSVYDFWEMVWQEGVKAIVSVNWPFEERQYPRTYDFNRETIQYWPLNKGEERKYMPWKVYCQWTKLKIRPSETTDGDDYLYRVSGLRLTECNPVLEPEPRYLLHICYYRWPDGQIPRAWGRRVRDCADAASVINDILRRELAGIRSTIVVHCHAGVGRTGVLLALDMALMALDRRFMQVEEIVRRVREQRPRAVMNPWQYTFINLAVAQYALRKRLLPLVVGDEQLATTDLLTACWNDLVADIRYVNSRQQNDDKDVAAFRD